jgi:hypothetical protein
VTQSAACIESDCFHRIESFWICYDAWWGVLASAIVLATDAGMNLPSRQAETVTTIFKARADQIMLFQSRLIASMFSGSERKTRMPLLKVLHQIFLIDSFPSCIIGVCDCDSYVSSFTLGKKVRNLASIVKCWLTNGEWQGLVYQPTHSYDTFTVRHLLSLCLQLPGHQAQSDWR